MSRIDALGLATPDEIEAYLQQEQDIVSRPPSPPSPPSPPDVSDGLSYPEAVDHYFNGPTNPSDPNRRSDLSIPFESADQGWGLEKFFDKNPCDLGQGWHEIQAKFVADLNNLGTFFTIAGPGQVDVRLNGYFDVSYGDGTGKWVFSGRITIDPNEFDFDKKTPGGRPWHKELQVWGVNSIKDWTDGKDFLMTFPGGRDVYEEGCCNGY